MLDTRRLLRERAFIDGDWTKAESGGEFDVKNPADGTVVGRIPDMGPQDAKRAVDAAHDALGEWSRRTAEERSDILRAWYVQMLDHREDLARLMTLEEGKPMHESRSEVEYGAGFVRWFSEEGRRAYGDVIPTNQADKRILAVKQPVGVCAAITPWNFPVAMITRKVAPALAVGCTVVAKPPSDAPLCSLALAALAAEAGVPAGVFNVVPTTDSSSVGQAFLSSPKVRKISFTGSTAVGKKLMSGAADTVKRVSFELGGNAPFIVFDDADIEAAVDGAVASKHRNAGQTCVCANRFYVQDGVHDEFVDAYADRVAALTVGPGQEQDTDIGPLINESAVKKVQRLVEDAKTRGARVLVGGSRHERGGTYYEPTVLIGVEDGMDIAREEIFGPVSSILRFTDEDDAVQRANDTPFGLASYFYTRDVGRVRRVSEALEYGMVGVNAGMVSTPVAPFGGVKESGLGREGSKYGIDEYLEIKYVCLGGV